MRDLVNDLFSAELNEGSQEQMIPYYFCYRVNFFGETCYDYFLYYSQFELSEEDKMYLDQLYKEKIINKNHVTPECIELISKEEYDVAVK